MRSGKSRGRACTRSVMPARQKAQIMADDAWLHSVRPSAEGWKYADEGQGMAGSAVIRRRNSSTEGWSGRKHFGMSWLLPVTGRSRNTSLSRRRTPCHPPPPNSTQTRSSVRPRITEFSYLLFAQNRDNSAILAWLEDLDSSWYWMMEVGEKVSSECVCICCVWGCEDFGVQVWGIEVLIVVGGLTVLTVGRYMEEWNSDCTGWDGNYWLVLSRDMVIMD